MDYPITVPGVGLSAGKFTNGNPVASLAASLDPAEWANAVTDEILNVITQGGLTPTENTNTQLATAIRNMIRGGDYKDSVRVASTVPINLAAPGANIDSTAMVLGDRFLEKDHATLALRGIYIWNGAAVAATRALDADTGAELNSGAIIPVETGTVNADTNWQLTTDGVVTIGTSGLTFAQLPSQFASNAEITTGVNANKSVSPLGLLQGLLGLGGAAANDYITIPYRDKTDGSRKNLIIQWGVNSSVGTAGISQVLPISFPNAFLKAYAVHNTPQGQPVYAMACNPVGLSSIVITSSNATLGQASYLAIGL